MWNKISFLQKKLVYTIPAFMLLGIFVGYFYDTSYLKNLIIPLTFLMVYPMMINLQIKKIFSHGDAKVQIVTQIINFAIIPFVAFGIGQWFFPNNPLITLGLLLAALLPTSGMTISWTGFAKGNLNAAIKMTIIGLILGALATPFYAKFLMGTIIEIPFMSIFQQIMLIVFLPLIAGNLTKKAIIWRYSEAKYHKDIKNKLPMFSTLGVLGIIFVAMSLKAKTIINQPTMLLSLLIPLILFYGFNFLLTTIIGKYLFSREDGIALVYGTVVRNLSIALAIAMTVFGEQGSDIALIIALALVIQAQTAAWYVKLTKKIFGKAPEDIVRDIMEEGLFALHNDSTLHDAIKLLDEEHIRSIAILDKNEKLQGVITAKLIINLLSDGVSMNSTLDTIKLLPVLKFKETTPVKKVIKSMKRKHEYKVIVINEEGELIGRITEGDIINKFAEEG